MNIGINDKTCPAVSLSGGALAKTDSEDGYRKLNLSGEDGFIWRRRIQKQLTMI